MVRSPFPRRFGPSKDQPFYHLLAENSESSYVAYVSQQNLVADESDEPIDHPAIATMFDASRTGATASGTSSGNRPPRLTLRRPLP